MKNEEFSGPQSGKSVGSKRLLAFGVFKNQFYAESQLTTANSFLIFITAIAIIWPVGPLIIVVIIQALKPFILCRRRVTIFQANLKDY